MSRCRANLSRIGRSDRLRRKRNDISNAFVDRVFSIILVISVSRADNVTSCIIVISASRLPRSALRACIGLTEKFLSRIETNLEPSREVSFQVARTVQILTLVKCNLLEDVVFARHTLFLLQE